MTTLARQLFAGTSIIFLACLAGIGAIYVVNSRLYLQEQLDSHAQDAATSLGLSLGARAAQGDPAAAETVINAAFDRGHYERIQLLDVNGRVLVEKSLPPAEAEVPRWFVRLLPLAAPTATSLVTQGWRQLGRVSVTSHPRLAYRQLWKTGYETLAWLALVYAFAAAAMRLFVAGLLKPLAEIERTAAAIAARDYRPIAVLPRTRELRLVVEAMNALSAKVRETIESETARAEQLRREAFHDALTGLWNRGGLAQQFEAHVLHNRDAYSGTLLLVELHDFVEFNRVHGYARGDQALKRVAAMLEQWGRSRHAIVARPAGTSFVSMAVNTGPGEAAVLAADICRRLDACLADEGLGEALRFNCGAAAFEHGKPALGALLAAADGALIQAQSRGSGAFEAAVLEPGPAAAGSMEWRERLIRTLAEDRFVLYGQPAISLPGRQTLHLEITTRLLDESGEAIPAARFLPMAARHGLVQLVDRKMLERLLARMHTAPSAATAVAVNLSASSAADADFLRWLEDRLEADRALASRLSFEISESGVMRDTAAALGLAAMVRKGGARFGVDAFGVHRESLQLLKRLLPDYVKLAGSHTASLQGDASSRFFVESVVRIARSLDIRVLAQAVESEDLVPLLTELGIAGCQGFAIGMPEPLG